jgi:hypothetical protein
MTVSMVHVSCDLDMAWTSWCVSQFIIHSPLGDCAVGVWLLSDISEDISEDMKPS